MIPTIEDLAVLALLCSAGVAAYEWLCVYGERHADIDYPWVDDGDGGGAGAVGSDNGGEDAAV